MDNPMVNPIEDRRKAALEHYKKLCEGHCLWNGFVETAIKYYNPVDNLTSFDDLSENLLWYNPKTGKTAKQLPEITGLNDNDGCYLISTKPSHNYQLLNALDWLLNHNEGHGCPMCDNGELRNPEKEHWDNCIWNNASKIYKKYTPQEKPSL